MKIKKIIDIAKKYGFKDSEIRIFLALLLAEKPLSQKEIKKQLKYSTGMVSISLNSLEKKGVVKVIKVGKIKRYEVIASFNLLFSNLIEKILQTDIALALQLIKNYSNQKVKKLINEYKELTEKREIIKKIVNLDKRSLQKIEKCLER